MFMKKAYSICFVSPHNLTIQLFLHLEQVHYKSQIKCDVWILYDLLQCTYISLFVAGAKLYTIMIFVFLRM